MTAYSLSLYEKKNNNNAMKVNDDWFAVVECNEVLTLLLYLSTFFTYL